MTYTVDNLMHVLSACDMQALLLLAQTCTFFRAAVGAEIRHRLAILLQPFFHDRIRHWSGLLRLHEAVMSGSLALALFLSPACWQPGDLDVYIGDDSYIPFVTDFERLFPFVLEADMSRPHLSPYSGIKRVRRYINSTGKRVELIQSRTSNAVSPLLNFWSSLVVNFITPHGAVCTYPKSTLSGKGLISPAIPRWKAVCARKKYEDRGITFTEVQAWRLGQEEQPDAAGIFSDGPLLVLDFQNVWSEVPFPLPIHRSGTGWVLNSPPSENHATSLASAEDSSTEDTPSPVSATSDRSQCSAPTGSDTEPFYALLPTNQFRSASVA